MRASGYIRVSTEEQAKHGWNLGADRERIEATITERGWTRHAIYDDGGRQGDDPDRPGFLAMLAEVDAFDVLIVRDLDRFSRNLAIYASAVDTLLDADVTLYEFSGDGSGLRQLDLSDEDDRALADVKAVFAQLEKAKIKRRVRQAKEARAKGGLHSGGRRPFGYRQRDTTHEGKPAGPLVVDPIEAPVVRRMFAIAEATSQRKIAQLLNAEGIRTASGGRWVQSMVARVLANPLYLGKVRRKVGGRWEVYDGQHDPIVDEALWQRVNASRATAERRAGGRPLATGHLLTRGLLRCGRCGSALIPVGSYNGRPETYVCIGRRDQGPGFCDQPSVRRTLIDEALLEQLTSRYLDLDGTRERLRERQATTGPLAQAALAEAEREASEAAEAVGRVKRDYTTGAITAAEWRELRADLDAELAGAQEAVEQARSRVEQISEAGTATDAEEALLAQLADLKALVSGTVGQARDVESLRTVIRQLFASVTLITPGPDALAAAAALGRPPEPYWLAPTLRPEMVDWTTMQPIKPPVPGDLTLPTCRRS
jgi:site-specific DNA recombinase